MSAKRKDKKGRVLRTGESQRKDLTYQYRYQDVTGKRRTVYAPTLEELRAKEDEINKAQDSGVDYNAGKHFSCTMTSSLCCWKRVCVSANCAG